MTNLALHRELPVLGKKVFPLGLACNYGIDAKGIEQALATDINYIYWTPRMKGGAAAEVIKNALQKDREKYILATGPTTAWWSGNATRFAEKFLRQMECGYIDILQIHWIGVTAVWNSQIEDELLSLKERGLARAVGISIHDRPRAAMIAQNSQLDSYMLRYNAAHTGAEQDVFPYIDKTKQIVIAYTATRWGKLLHAPSGYTGYVPTAGACYRFCLGHAKVDVVLSGPKDQWELDENCAAVKLGALSADEEINIRDFGKIIRGK